MKIILPKDSEFQKGFMRRDGLDDYKSNRMGEEWGKMGKAFVKKLGIFSPSKIPRSRPTYHPASTPTNFCFVVGIYLFTIIALYLN